jgi:hypothetical protein
LADLTESSAHVLAVFYQKQLNSKLFMNVSYNLKRHITIKSSKQIFFKENQAESLN